MISVIVPVYNIAPYLDRCLTSILRQTLRELEIVCTDDGSADGSAAVLDEKAAENDNILVIHKRNEGVTVARLAGVRLSRGGNVGFCDGDDEIEPDMYERLLNNKLRYNADISHCGHKVVYPDGREKYFYNTGRLAQQDRTEGLKDLLSGSFEPGLWSKLYSKTLLHSLLHSGRMDVDVKINEDLLMNYYLFKEARMTVYEDVCLYDYLKRDGSASGKKSERFVRDPIYVREIILNDIPEQNRAVYIPAMLSFIRISISMYMYCLKHDPENREELLKKFRKNIFVNRKYLKYGDIGGAVHAYMILIMPGVCKLVFRNY